MATGKLRISRRDHTHALVWICLVAYTACSSIDPVAAFSNPIHQRQKTEMAMLSQQQKGTSSSFMLVEPLDRRTLLASLVFGGSIAVTPSHAVAAASLPFSRDRRQLEVCLVSVLRVLYWAQATSTALRQADNPSRRQDLYLEARLGAKASLTKKVGSGANARVLSLASLQIPESLVDLQYYYSSSTVASTRQFDEWSREWSESLAALVEFDGLDTLTDPSPRASLAKSQYTDQKADFCQRMLAERVVPDGKRLLRAFPEVAVARAQGFIEQYYAGEIVPL